MNYFQLLKAFYDELEINPLNTSEIALWHALAFTNNKTAWSSRFTVASSVLRQKADLKKTNFFKSRNGLQQKGYIKWKQLGANRAAEYQIIDLDKVLSSHGELSSGRTSELSSELSSGPLTNRTELNITDEDDDARETSTRKSFELWEQLWGFPNAIAIPAIDEWISTVGDDMLKLAITYAGERNVQAKGALNYVSKIVDSWERKGIKTVDQAEESRKKHDQRTSNARDYQKKAQIIETIPDEFKEDYKPEHKETSPEQLAEIQAQMERLKPKEDTQ